MVAVVSGGQGDDEPETEAECMYRQLVNLGIQPERILMETQAKSTWENLRFSLDLLEQETGSRPAVKAGNSLQRVSPVPSQPVYEKSRSGIRGHSRGDLPSGARKVTHFMREVAGVLALTIFC